jgi:hypothetical protein
MKVRNRLILELMVRGEMIVGEVLKLAPRDVNKQKITIQNPQSGKDAEGVFIPRKVVDGLQRTYRVIVKNAGKLADSHPETGIPVGEGSSSPENQ